MGGRKTSLAAPWIIFAVQAALLWIVAAWIRARGTAYPRSVLVLGALAWFIWSIRLRTRQWRVDDVPTSECANVPVGFAEATGRARLDPPLAARGSATPCAYYKWELQEHRRSGKSSRWVTVESESGARPFRVVDSTGEVWVDPEHAEMIGINQHVSSVPGRTRKWRQIEWRLDIDEPVYVLGPTRVRAGAALVEFGTDEPSDEFIVSDEAERKVRNRIAFAAWTASILGALAAGLAFVVRAEPTFDSDGDPTVAYHFVDSWARVWRFSLVAAAMFVALLVISWIFRAYNRLVRVRGQAERAWSLIAIELQRRFQLLTNLIEVVRGYTRYEQRAQEGLTRVRTELPTSPELVDAASADQGARDQVRSLIALAESSPELRANEQFLALQRAIAVTEDRVAAARRFYNDAVTISLDRRQVFPAVMVASWVEWPSFELFEPDAADRQPPDVSVAPR